MPVIFNLKQAFDHPEDLAEFLVKHVAPSDLLNTIRAMDTCLADVEWTERLWRDSQHALEADIITNGAGDGEFIQNVSRRSRSFRENLSIELESRILERTTRHVEEMRERVRKGEL